MICIGREKERRSKPADKEKELVGGRIGEGSKLEV